MPVIMDPSDPNYDPNAAAAENAANAINSFGGSITSVPSDVYHYAGKMIGAEPAYNPQADAFKLPGYQDTLNQSQAGYQAMGGANAGQINMQNQTQGRLGQNMLASMLYGQAQGASPFGGLADSLTQQMNGGGPNLAAQQLRQGTDRNIAQAYAMAQANQGNAGAMRNIASQVSGLNQQAAGDAATQRMQQQLAAQQQLGQVLGMQGQYQQGTQNMLGSLLQGQRGQDIGVAQGQAGLNAQMAQAYMQQAQNANTTQGQMNVGLQQMLSGLSGDQLNRAAAIIGAVGQGATAIGTGGASKIPGHAYGGEIGAMVPGQASVNGDSEKNDTVDAKLSPGEIVLPRSVAQAPDAPYLAKLFVEAIQKKHGKGAA